MTSDVCRPLRRAARWDGVVGAMATPEGGLGRLAPDQVAELAAEVRRHRTVDGSFDVTVINPALPAERDVAAYAAAGATWYLLAGWTISAGSSRRDRPADRPPAANGPLAPGPAALRVRSLVGYGAREGRHR